MNLPDAVVLIPLALLAVGFVYINFIFPKKAKKEEAQKENINR